jgi:signal transduction histidine kinase/ActR/RegA family two-component response regulator
VTERVNDPLITGCRLAARTGAAVVLCLCVFVLIGWISNVPALTSLAAGQASMSMATALCCILGSICILCRNIVAAPEGFGRHLVGWGGAGIIVVAGLYALVSYFWFPGTMGGYVFGGNLGQIAPATAISFILLGLVLLSEGQLRGFLSSGLAALGLMISFIALAGYAFHVDTLRQVSIYAAMALPTAVAFTLLFCGTLLTRPRDGWMAYLSGADPGGVAARRLLPAVIIVPFAISLAATRFRGAGPLAAEFGFAWVTVATVVVLGVLICFTSALLSRSAAALTVESVERRRAEERLVQAQKMEAIGNLTGGMAHDFNNLLGIIMGNLDLLRSDAVLTPETDELVGEAIDAAIRGADLTRRLLAFARRQPLQPKRVAINELVSGMVNLLRRTLGEDIDISLDLAPEVWAVVVDPAQLESALVNLANNARDAMPKGGRLMIATGNRPLDADYASMHTELAPGDYAMIEIGDTGTGMPPDVIAHVFEPFFTTKETGKGTGLGLSMVFGFVKQSAGHINVYSEPGQGTTFRLYLPRAVDQDSTALPPPSVARPAGGKETVLVVEDNLAMRRVVRRQLTELGYHVLEAERASVAIELLVQENIDLMFSDIVMPGEVNGIELAREAVTRWPALKVVLTSGFPQARLEVGGDASADIHLLSKPYRRDDLARLLRGIFDAGQKNS